MSEDRKYLNTRCSLAIPAFLIYLPRETLQIYLKTKTLPMWRKEEKYHHFSFTQFLGYGWEGFSVGVGGVLGLGGLGLWAVGPLELQISNHHLMFAEKNQLESHSGPRQPFAG